MIRKPTDEEREAILVRCIPCFVDGVETRYNRGQYSCPTCGRSNDKGFKKGEKV